MQRRPGSLRVLFGCGVLLGAFGLPAGAARASITFVAGNGNANAGGTTSLAITKPRGLAAGDVMVATVGASGTGALSAPSGWTQIADTTTQTALRQTSYYRVAGSSEPASYTFSLGSSRTASGGIVAYRGVNATTPIDASASATGAAGNGVAPSVPTTAPNERIVLGGSFAAVENVTPDPSTTLRYGQASNASVTGAADFVQASPGSTPVKTDTPSSTTAPWVFQTIALRDAATGALTVSSSAAPSFSVNLNGGDQAPTFTVPMTLTDTRTGSGSAAGWNLSITSTQYTTGTATLATNASAITALSATCDSGGSCVSPASTVSQPVSVPAAPTAPMPAKLTNATAGTGMGKFTVTPTVAVSVPQNSYAGAYRSTLTVSLSSGP